MTTIFRAPIATLPPSAPRPSPRDHPPPNLLNSTLRPPGVPFAQLDWPNPPQLRQPTENRGFVNALRLELIGKDTFFAGPGRPPVYDWPNPRGRPQVTRDCTTGDGSLACLFPVLLQPGRQHDFPNPPQPRQPTENRGFVEGVRLELIGRDALPTGRLLDWPNPGRPRQPVSDFVRADLLIGTLAVPVGRLLDWPNPQAARQPLENRGFVGSLHLNLLGQDQFFGPAGLGPSYHYPNPGRLRPPLLDFPPPNLLANLEYPPVGRLLDWPNPGRLRQPLLDFPPPNLLVGTLARPTFQTDWPNPRGPQHPLANRGFVVPLNLDLLGQDALPVGRLLDWPNPRAVRPTPQADSGPNLMAMSYEFQLVPDRRYGAGRSDDIETD